MAYVEESQVQQWLQQSKYNIAGIDLQHEERARDVAFAKLERRYDTSTWTNTASTPEMVINIMTMLVASYTLRKAIGEDDGEHDYPDWLEGRATELLDQLSGLGEVTLDIPGIVPDPASVEQGVPAFWPTQAATDLWFEDPTAEGGAARAFDMQRVF